MQTHISRNDWSDLPNRLGAFYNSDRPVSSILALACFFFAIFLILLDWGSPNSYWWLWAWTLCIPVVAFGSYAKTYGNIIAGGVIAFLPFILWFMP